VNETISLVELINKLLDEKASKPDADQRDIARCEAILSELIGYAVRQPEKLEGVYQ